MKAQKPIIENESGSGDGKILNIKHPAFGKAVLSRVNGDSSELFGSAGDLGSFIQLEFYEVSENWHLSRKWVNDEKLKFRAYFTNYQFAELITNMNHGEGSRATIVFDGNKINPLVVNDPEEILTHHKLDVANTIQNIEKSISQLEKAVKELNIPNKSKQALQSNIDKCKMDLTSNLPFIESSYKEALEEETSRFKTELACVLEHRLSQLGKEFLANSQNKLNSSQ